MKSKIVKVDKDVREWNNPQGGTIYYHTIELENGDVGSIGAKQAHPDWLKELEILEYTKDRNKIKRVSQNNFGGGFKKKSSDKMKSWGEISTMLKLNALHCAMETEKATKGDVSRQDALPKYLEFLSDLPHSYRNGIDKWGKENVFLINKMGVTNRVAELFYVDKEIGLDDIVSKCNEYLNWCSSPL